NGVIAVQEGTATEPLWIDLEDGVEIAFTPGGAYRTGDYWLIPARVATGSVQWPTDGAGKAVFEPPRGIEHHYAPLGFLRLGDNAGVESCRCEFEPAGDCFAHVSAATGVRALTDDQLRIAETPTITPAPKPGPKPKPKPIKPQRPGPKRPG